MVKLLCMVDIAEDVVQYAIFGFWLFGKIEWSKCVDSHLMETGSVWVSFLFQHRYKKVDRRSDFCTLSMELIFTMIMLGSLGSIRWSLSGVKFTWRTSGCPLSS